MQVVDIYLLFSQSLINKYAHMLFKYILLIVRNFVSCNFYVQECTRYGSIDLSNTD